MLFDKPLVGANEMADNSFTWTSDKPAQQIPHVCLQIVHDGSRFIEKRCIGGFCSPLEYGAGLDQSEIQRGRSFAECDPGRSLPPDRIGSAGANWNGNIKARTTTPGIVPGSLLSFGVIILFANNNIVCHRLPNNPAFTRLFLERIKLFWIE